MVEEDSDTREDIPAECHTEDANFDLSTWLGPDTDSNLDYDTSVRAVVMNLTGESIQYRHVIGLLSLSGFAVLPFVISPGDTAIVTRMLFLVMFGLSWDIVSGYTGQVSLGHAFFFAIGGYSTAALNVYFGLSPIVTIFAGMVIATFGGLLLGIPALRVRGPFLALVTLIAPFLLLRTFIYYSRIFGGTDGFTPLPDPLVGTADSAVISVDSFSTVVTSNYYLAYGLFLVILFILLTITRLSTGEVLTAIRENESVPRSCGINTAKFKLFSFLISAAVGGVAGAVFVHTIVGSPHPDELLNLQLSLDVIIFSVVGGIGTIIGPVIGVLVVFTFELLLEQLDFTIPIINQTFGDLQPVPLFVMTLLVIFYMPGGILRWGLRATEDYSYQKYLDTVVAWFRK